METKTIITTILITILIILFIVTLIFIVWSYLDTGKLTRNGKYIGRVYDYKEQYILKPLSNITAEEVAIILSDFVNGGFDPDFISNLSNNIERHFKKMSLKEFDKAHNPDMEIDE